MIYIKTDDLTYFHKLGQVPGDWEGNNDSTNHYITRYGKIQ